MTQLEWIRLLCAIAAVLYIGAAVLYRLLKRRLIAYIVHGIAWAVNMAVVLLNWVNNGYVPFISMYQVVTFLGASFGLTYLYMIIMHRGQWMGMAFAFCAGLCAIGVQFMEVSVLWIRPPALQSVWFFPHVFAYMLSYSLCAVAAVLTLLQLFESRRRLTDKAAIKQRDQLVAQLEQGVYHLILFAFPFMTAGLMLGAIWADQVWGDFWSWDLKENWALITWLCYMLYLHVRYTKWKQYAYLFSLVGFVALLITFFGVNLMPDSNSMHAYT